MVLKSLSDVELVTSLKAGEHAALSKIYDRYSDTMYWFAVRLLGQPQEAEDLLQEIFMTLYYKCAYQSERGSLKTYLMMLVHSRSLDRLRSRKSQVQRQQRLQGYGPLNDPSTPLDHATDSEVAQRVRTALGELPEKQRQALEMAYYEGLTQVEIAKRLSVPVGTVKSWFRLSFDKLRRKLVDLTG
jgi:RNA polymerase sigma-70 factor, ECF subfamily